MRSLCGYLLLGVILLYALGVSVGSQGVLAASPDFTVSPTTINRHQTVWINITVNQLPGLVTYTFNVSLTMPDNSVVFRSVMLTTDFSGVGSNSSLFPQDFPGGTTLIDGSYRVSVSEIQPLPSSIGSKLFSVSSQIDLTILNPNSSYVFTRGNSTLIVAQAKDVQGKDLPNLSVNFTTPSNTSLPLTNLLGTAIYQGSYTILYGDSLSWRIFVSASDSWGNFGSATVNVGVKTVKLSLDPIHITDSSGHDKASTSVNQTIYVFFKARYPDNSLVTSGSASVSVIAPNNVPLAILNATYSSSMGGFFTQAGYFIRPDQAAGRWSAVIYTAKLDDGSGNTGPAVPVSKLFDVTSLTFNLPLPLVLPFLLLGLGAIGSAVVLNRKSWTGFEYFDKITGGGIPDGSLVMLYGESKSGKSLLMEEMLYRRLKEGKPCVYITYELTTAEIMKNAGDFKWDLDPYVETGLLTLIDNSDLTSSLDLSKTRMKLSAALTMKENRGLELFIDSMDLLFEDLDYREVKFFLSKLTEEVRRLHGSVYFSLTTTHIIRQTIPEIQDIIDWSIELQTRKKGAKMERIMSVKKLKDTSFKAANSRFKLVKRRGMVFDVPLIRKLGRS